MSRVLEAMDKTYMIELVTEVPPVSNQIDQKYLNRDLKTKFWGEGGEKFNFTGKYSNNNACKLQYNTNLKQRLLFINKSQLSSSNKYIMQGSYDLQQAN
jgi:hypothetical protein